MSWNGYENNVLLRNDGCGTGATPQFTNVAMALGADDIRDARGVAIADFDNDGDLDVVINHNPGDTGSDDPVPATLLRNEIGHGRNWLAVELQGTASNRDAVGAKVRIRAGGIEQLRLRSAGSGYASQHSDRLYFGVGAEARIEEVSVSWPSGRVETFGEMAANQLVRITEKGGLELMPLPGSAVDRPAKTSSAGGVDAGK